MKRRNFLTITGTAGAAGIFASADLMAANPSAFLGSWDSSVYTASETVTYPGNNDAVYRELFGVLKDHLIDCLERSKVQYDNNFKIHSPCVSSGYRGLWPDDFLYPLLVVNGLYDKSRLSQISSFLTESIADLDVFPDRVDADGMPMMHPGWAYSQHPTERMPNHLPAAWIRLLDNLEQLGAEIPRKEDLAKLFKRAMDTISFACGLAYSDPQHPRVGFGFHDMTAITGFELMSSMVLHFGLKRAVRFFDGYIDKEELNRWNRLSDRITKNLFRLYDEEQGAYLAGSKDCRQINVWGNGLAYWMSNPEIRKRIGEYYDRNRKEVFLMGATRQIAEPEGWQRMWTAKYDEKLGRYESSPAGGYINGGYWSVGTGWVLPAIAMENPEFAVGLAMEMVENAVKSGFPEFISSEGKAGGASGFLAGIAVPMMGIKAILEKRPLSDFF